MTAAKTIFRVASYVPFSSSNPRGIPAKEEITNRQVLLNWTSRQLVTKIVIVIVLAIMATRGVAVFKSTMIARRGIAISASPNPNVERTKVDKNKIHKMNRLCK